MARQPAFFDVFSFERLPTPPADCRLIGGEADPALDYLVGPAFFDPQVNGYAGVDFQDPDVTLDALEHAAEQLARAGCPHFLLTIITGPDDFLRDHFARLAGFLERSERLRRHIPGFHLEGPFLNDNPGYRGAHRPELMTDPQWDRFAAWQAASGDRIRMLTIAPERAGAVDFIRRAVAAGVFLCAGHSAATRRDLLAAVQAGLRLYTHLGNGAPLEIPRHANVIQDVLSVPGLAASLIADGIHLPPYVLANFARALGSARLVLTTDAMAAAGAPTGRYALAGIALEVGDDRVVRNPNAPGFAGSALSPLEGFYNGIQFAGLGAAASWHAWTWLRRELFPDLAPPRIALPFPAPPSSRHRLGL
ncbi:MAG TPA: N-acetylglucosamine-6-phosphate deacetylase [Candidatus Sumerlaeota bacterium]|nr:N-acetylglucosamine-6-phosphate deacetylase [Candidatus Sumerlaeota bacterium]